MAAELAEAEQGPLARPVNTSPPKEKKSLLGKLVNSLKGPPTTPRKRDAPRSRTPTLASIQAAQSGQGSMVQSASPTPHQMLAQASGVMGGYQPNNTAFQPGATTAGWITDPAAAAAQQQQQPPVVMPTTQRSPTPTGHLYSADVVSQPQVAYSLPQSTSTMGLDQSNPFGGVAGLGYAQEVVPSIPPQLAAQVVPPPAAAPQPQQPVAAAGAAQTQYIQGANGELYEIMAQQAPTPQVAQPPPPVTTQQQQPQQQQQIIIDPNTGQQQVVTTTTTVTAQQVPQQQIVIDPTTGQQIVTNTIPQQQPTPIPTPQAPAQAPPTPPSQQQQFVPEVRYVTLDGTPISPAEVANGNYTQLPGTPTTPSTPATGSVVNVNHGEVTQQSSIRSPTPTLPNPSGRATPKPPQNGSLCMDPYSGMVQSPTPQNSTLPPYVTEVAQMPQFAYQQSSQIDPSKEVIIQYNGQGGNCQTTGGENDDFSKLRMENEQLRVQLEKQAAEIEQLRKVQLTQTTNFAPNVVSGRLPSSGGAFEEITVQQQQGLPTSTTTTVLQQAAPMQITGNTNTSYITQPMVTTIQPQQTTSNGQITIPTGGNPQYVSGSWQNPNDISGGVLQTALPTDQTTQQDQVQGTTTTTQHIQHYRVEQITLPQSQSYHQNLQSID